MSVLHLNSGVAEPILLRLDIFIDIKAGRFENQVRRSGRSEPVGPIATFSPFRSVTDLAFVLALATIWYTS